MLERLSLLSIKRRRAAAFVFLLLIATVAFIWGNSLQSPAESMQRSDVAERLVRPIIMVTPIQQWHSDEMITFITRKLGHFIEFFLLGTVLMALSWVLHPAYRLRFVYLLLFAVAIASLDEALQLTNGRGAAVADVLLDTFGALAGLLAMKIVARLFMGRRDKHA